MLVVPGEPAIMQSVFCLSDRLLNPLNGGRAPAGAQSDAVFRGTFIQVKARLDLLLEHANTI